MNRRNYQKELDRVLKDLTAGKKVPTLLLHSCCAPCSSYVLEYLSRYFEITDFFYNPNIEPEAEYRKRSRELQRMIGQIKTLHPVRFKEGRYDPGLFHDTVKGHEADREGGERCSLCFELRLREAARLAKAGEYDYFVTTLSISPLKNAEKLMSIGERLGQEYGVSYLPSDFKKKDGYKRSVELSALYGLYRQDYCGCIYSKAERMRQKDAQGHGQEEDA